MRTRPARRRPPPLRCPPGVAEVTCRRVGAWLLRVTADGAEPSAAERALRPRRGPRLLPLGHQPGLGGVGGVGGGPGPRGMALRRAQGDGPTFSRWDGAEKAGMEAGRGRLVGEERTERKGPVSGLELKMGR
jgi:hypothetical protein